MMFQTKGLHLNRLCFLMVLGAFFCFSFSGAAAPVDWSKPQPLEISGPLDTAIDRYAELTGRTAIRNSALAQTKIILQGNGLFSKEDAIIAIENVMTANNLTIILQGEKFFKVVQSPAAKQEAVPLSAGDSKLSATDQMVSRYFQMKYVDVKDAEQAVRPLLHPTGLLTSLQRTNALLITDRSANILEMQKILDLLDRPSEGKVKAKFYLLKNATAKDVWARLKELLEQSPGAQGQRTTTIPVPQPVPGGPPVPQPPGGTPSMSVGTELTFSEEAVVVGKVTFSADDRTNQLIVLTRAVNFPFFDQVIEKLDTDTADPMILKTIPLKYADAEPLAGLIGQVLGVPTSTAPRNERISDTGAGSRNSAPGSRTPTQSQPQPRGGAPATPAGGAKQDASVHADTRTNSLIALGPREKIEWVQSFVRDVDVPLPQVLLEGVIVEVTLNRTDSFGVEVLSRATTKEGSHAALINTLAINPVDAATVATGAIPGGVSGGLNYFASLKDTKMDVLIQALAQNSNVKILSQPLIQASHNERAKILVGEQRPIVTGTTSTPSTTGTTSTSSSFQQVDIALELEVKPLINPGGLVVLDILQKVNSVAGSQRIDANDVPIISRREASSIVSVQDGEMIILGGLVGDTEKVTKSGVPLLSDIPLLGLLFSSTAKEKVRTELMVLLKPTVLVTPEVASEEATRRRKELELFKKKSLIEKNNLNDKIDKIALPPSVPAEKVELVPGEEASKKGPVTNFKY